MEISVQFCDVQIVMCSSYRGHQSTAFLLPRTEQPYIREHPTWHSHQFCFSKNKQTFSHNEFAFSKEALLLERLFGKQDSSIDISWPRSWLYNPSVIRYKANRMMIEPSELNVSGRDRIVHCVVVLQTLVPFLISVFPALA